MNNLTRLSTELTNPSPLYFGYDIAAPFSQKLDEAMGDQPADKIFLVVDPDVHDLHDFGRLLLETRPNVEVIPVDPGEASKSWAGLEIICEQLVSKGASKRSVVVAFGGGSLGNLSGLAAALLFRGIRYVEVPTSFMHMTDGVLSNKQAINGRLGKNHFGVYHAPIFIWADVRYLETEPIRSRKAGMAEAVKNALVSNPELVTQLRDLLRPDGRYAGAELRQLALTTITSKLAILRRDPTEKHYALALEYGHTFGHALEWLSGGAFLHGECVAIGMKMAAHLANEQKMIPDQLVDLHYELIDSCLGLVPTLPARIDARSLVATMRCDNKKTGNSMRFVLLDALGSCTNPNGDYLVTINDDAYVLDFVDRFLRTYPERIANRVQCDERARGAAPVLPWPCRAPQSLARSQSSRVTPVLPWPCRAAQSVMRSQTGRQAPVVKPGFPDLEGRHVLITGGSNGIGAAVAIAFAGQGCQLTLLDRDVEGGRRVIRACHDLGADARLREVDLMDSRMLSEVLAQVREEQPAVDVLIANAGYDPRFTGLDMSERQWHDLFQLNVTHYFVTCRELLPAMIAKSGGSIIMTASHTAWLGKPDLIAYNSTKAAIIGFMRSLAESVGPYRIRVNAVAPGWTMTERQLRQWVTDKAKHRTIHEDQVMPIELTPDELTGTYLFLASDCSRPITRQVLVADAGQSKH